MGSEAHELEAVCEGEIGELGLAAAGPVGVVAALGSDERQGAIDGLVLELARTQALAEPRDRALVADREVAGTQVAAEEAPKVPHELAREQGANIAVVVLEQQG